MNGIKATIIFCMTMGLMFMGYLWQKNSKNDFVVLSSAAEKGVYVFNGKQGELQHCASDAPCVVIPLVVTHPVIAPVKEVVKHVAPHMPAMPSHVQPHAAAPVAAHVQPHAAGVPVSAAAHPALAHKPAGSVHVVKAHAPAVHPTGNAQDVSAQETDSTDMGAAVAGSPAPVEQAPHPADQQATADQSAETPEATASTQAGISPQPGQDGDFASAVEAPE